MPVTDTLSEAKHLTQLNETLRFAQGDSRGLPRHSLQRDAVQVDAA